MQSMFRLPWSTESPGDKIMEKATLHKSRPMPPAEIPNFINKFKRKRTDSPEPASAQHAHVVKKWKGALGDARVAVPVNANAAVVSAVTSQFVSARDTSNPASTQSLDPRPKVQPSSKEGANMSHMFKLPQPVARTDSINMPTTSMDSGLTAVQQAIEAQINYEILLKHNELRLIEQELAKCQVSLEQLRRCSLIPFPGTDRPCEDVSLGLGAALRTPSGYTQPHYAAPWGVTDGPYTRHYAKWLISDIQFDPVSERARAQQAQGYFGMGEGRTTRGSFADFGPASRGRTSRTSTGMLKITPLGETPAPTPKIDPLLHKRSTDGQWVRLFCAQCAHSNFSNTQGFLNHCRIKHNQVFKSHDQAAIACGLPVDVNEVGNPVTATEPISTPATTPAVTCPAAATTGIVHPLATPSTLVPQVKSVHRDPTASPPIDSHLTTPANFTKLSSTPYLMSHVQKSGFQGDLKALVDVVRSKVEHDAMDPSDDDSGDASAALTPTSAMPPHLARLPASAPHVSSANKVPSARPGSKKGSIAGHARLPLSLPLPIKAKDDQHMLESPVDLSPNTVESNPGLVSDHDDDDDDDADDARSQPDLIMDDDVMVEDASDVEGVQERTGSRQGLNGCFEKGEGSRQH